MSSRPASYEVDIVLPPDTWVDSHSGMFQRAWVGSAAREASTHYQSVETAAASVAPHAASAYFSASATGVPPVPTAAPGRGRSMDGLPVAAFAVPAVELPGEPVAAAAATNSRPAPGWSPAGLGPARNNAPFPLFAGHPNLHLHNAPQHGKMGIMAPSPRAPSGHQPSMHRIQSGAELNRTPSLQFAMEFDDDVQQGPRMDAVKVKMAIEQMWRLMACSQADEREIQHIVSDARDRLQSRPEQWTCANLAKVLEGMGYDVCIRTALGGGEGVDCLRNLRHNFLVVRSPGESSGASYIVDIDFKAQFAVASPTTFYQALIENMDSEFIGTEDKLRKVIHMLCDEMATAFKEQEIGLPPWRQPASMLSKWCPRRSADFSANGERFHRGESSPPGKGDSLQPRPLVDATTTPLPWEPVPQHPPTNAVVLAALGET